MRGNLGPISVKINPLSANLKKTPTYRDTQLNEGVNCSYLFNLRSHIFKY